MSTGLLASHRAQACCGSGQCPHVLAGVHQPSRLRQPKVLRFHAANSFHLASASSSSPVTGCPAQCSGALPACPCSADNPSAVTAYQQRSRASARCDTSTGSFEGCGGHNGGHCHDHFHCRSHNSSGSSSNHHHQHRGPGSAGCTGGAWATGTTQQGLLLGAAALALSTLDAVATAAAQAATAESAVRAAADSTSAIASSAATAAAAANLVAAAAGAASAAAAAAATPGAAPALAAGSSYVPSPMEPGWEIWVGFIAGVVPFLIASYEFGKRIIIQRRCEVCGGRGLVPSAGAGRDRYLRKCPQCGGFFPWISWTLFLSATAAPGNGGPLQQPRGQSSVFYRVPGEPDPGRQAEALARSQVVVDTLQRRGRKGMQPDSGTVQVPPEEGSVAEPAGTGSGDKYK